MAAVLALLSSALWGTADFLGGMVAKRVPAFVVVATTQGLALVMLVPVVLLTQAWHAPLGYLWWGVAAGVVGPLALAAFYHALSIGRMGVVSPISATAIAVPVGIGLLSGERPAVAALVGIALAAFGVVLAGGPDARTDLDATQQHGLRPVLFALAAAVGFGLVYVLLDGGAKSSVLMTLVAMRGASAVLVGVPVLLTLGLGGLRRRDLPMLTGIGVGDVAANGLFAWSSTLGLLSVTAVLGSLFPVATLALARVVLGERLTRLQTVGVTLAMSGVCLLAAAGA